MNILKFLKKDKNPRPRVSQPYPTQMTMFDRSNGVQFSLKADFLADIERNIVRNGTPSTSKPINTSQKIGALYGGKVKSRPDNR